MIDRVKGISRRFMDKMTADRVFLGGSFAEYAGVVVLFFLIAAALTNFVVFSATKLFTTYAGDGTGGFLWYTFAQPGIDLFLDHSDMVNYPFGEAIGGPTFITYMALWLPIRVFTFLFGSVVGMNLFMMFGYLLSAMSAYWFIRRLKGGIAVGIFAGYAVAFTPYAIQKSLDHIPYILSYVFVFMIAAFVGLVTRPTKLRAFIFALTIAICFYTDGYYLLIGTVLVLCMVASYFLYILVSRGGWQKLWGRIKYLFLSALFLVVLMLPVALLQFSQGGEIKESLEGRRSNISAELKAYRSNVIDFIIPSHTHPVLTSSDTFNTIHEYKSGRSNQSESTTYVGYVVGILVVLGILLIGIWLVRKRDSSLRTIDERLRNNYILMGCIVVVSIPVMLSFMFSPEVIVFGYRIPLIGQLFIDYDISLWRVMTRFFVAFHAILALFAALSLWVVCKILADKYRLSKWGRMFVLWMLPVLLVGVVAFEYATTTHRTSFDFNNMNEGYRWLQKQPSIETVVETSVVDPLDRHTADYVTAQIIHGKKLLNFKEKTDQPLTNILGGIDNPEMIDWAFDRGADAIIVHGRVCTEMPWGVVLYDGGQLTENMCVYRLDRPTTSDTTYIMYRDGFARRPNSDDQQNVVMSGLTGRMIIVDERFTLKDDSSRAVISAKIDFADANFSDGDWKAVQGGEVIAAGVFNPDNLDIVLNVQKNKAVEFRVQFKDPRAPEANIILKNVTATAE